MPRAPNSVRVQEFRRGRDLWRQGPPLTCAARGGRPAQARARVRTTNSRRTRVAPDAV